MISGYTIPRPALLERVKTNPAACAVRCIEGIMHDMGGRGQETDGLALRGLERNGGGKGNGAGTARSHSSRRSVLLDRAPSGRMSANAEGGIRTLTPFRAHGPKPCASAVPPLPPGTGQV